MLMLTYSPFLRLYSSVLYVPYIVVFVLECSFFYLLTDFDFEVVWYFFWNLRLFKPLMLGKIGNMEFWTQTSFVSFLF